MAPLGQTCWAKKPGRGRGEEEEEEDGGVRPGDTETRGAEGW